jgi:hypothetical protein
MNAHAHLDFVGIMVSRNWPPFTLGLNCRDDKSHLIPTSQSDDLLTELRPLVSPSSSPLEGEEEGN